MNITSQFANPEDIEVTISATMTVGQWRDVHRRLNEPPYNYPSWEFAGAISKAASVAIEKSTIKIPEKETVKEFVND